MWGGFGLGRLGGNQPPSGLESLQNLPVGTARLPTAGTLRTIDLITLGRGLGVPGRGHLGEHVWVPP